tara:strand:- start:260 stop:805 length:546 start_codon:yes stop_codon:yes gene_type:complete
MRAAMCKREMKSIGQGELRKDIANLKYAMAEYGVMRGFMNAAFPVVIWLFLRNGHCRTRDAYLAALADAIKEAYKTTTASGLNLPLECPDLALSRHMLLSDSSDIEFLKLAASDVEALNRALQNVPQGKVRVHICSGNYEHPQVVANASIGVRILLAPSVGSQAVIAALAPLRGSVQWTPK